MKHALWLIATLLLGGCISPRGPAVDPQKSESYYYGRCSRSKVYYSPGGNWLELGWAEVKGAHIASFEVLGPTYAKDANRAYFEHKAIPDAVVESFVGFLLTPGDIEGRAYPYYAAYAMDQRRVFYEGKPMAQAHAPSFELILVPASPSFRHHYTKDKNAVYRRENPVPGADPQSFQVLTDLWSKDRNHVFYDGEIVESADPATFQWLHQDPFGQDRTYAKDGTAVYHRTRRLEGVDPESFEIFDGEYTRDKNRVFFKDEAIAGADRGSFQEIGGSYWYRDRDHVFFQEMLLEGADPQTLQILPENHGYAIDRFRAYHIGWEKDSGAADDAWPRPRRRVFRALEVDTATFQPLSNCGYAKDKDRVYFELAVVPGADPATFQVRNNCRYGDDAKNSYFRGEKFPYGLGAPPDPPR